MGCGECRLEQSYSLELLYTCGSVAFQFTLQNGGVRQHGHRMQYLSLTSLATIRTLDLLNRETLASKRDHGKVKQINRVGRYRIDRFNGQLTNFGHTEEARKARNHNCKFTKEIYIWQSGCIYFNRNDREQAPNWQWRIVKMPNFTKTPGMATSCKDFIQHIFHEMLHQIWRYDGHMMHYGVNWCFRPPSHRGTFARGNTHWHWMQLRSNCHQEIQLV